MTDQTTLEVRNLRKDFGGLRAIENLNLDVRDGELVGLIGPNGAGKTALINMITGFYRATAGSILFLGKDITAADMHEIGRLGVARTFQNIRLFRRMTVLENVLVAHKPFATHPIRALFGSGFNSGRPAFNEAMRLLEMLQIADKADQLASSLSFGDARRLEIARAMAVRPRLLLLDEPAAGMNESETKQLVDDIRLIRNQVSSILLIEHDMDLIQQLSDRVVAMDYGRKIAEGIASDVLRHPDVVRAYLGEDVEQVVR